MAELEFGPSVLILIRTEPRFIGTPGKLMVWPSKQVRFGLLQTYVSLKCLCTIYVDEGEGLMKDCGLSSSSAVAPKLQISPTKQNKARPALDRRQFRNRQFSLEVGPTPGF